MSDEKDINGGGGGEQSMTSPHDTSMSERLIRFPDEAAVRAVLMAKRVVERDFPAYWNPVEVALTVCATLSLMRNANPVALVFVGPSSSGKSTTVEMLSLATRAYLSDRFTPASFVTQRSADDAAQLAGVDLLPKIKHKVLLVPELAPMFRKEQHRLEEDLSILTRVLDGRGLQTDAGTHGRRGYVGDYLFSLLGATTPLALGTHRVLTNIGSRLLYYRMAEPAEKAEANVVEELLGADSYLERFQRCQALVSSAVDALPAPRSIEWQSGQDYREAMVWIVRLADLLAVTRAVPLGMMGKGPFTDREDPSRARAQLLNIARGRALLYGRRSIGNEDLEIVTDIVLSSMPEHRGPILRALMGVDVGLSFGDLEKIVPLHRNTIENKVEQLEELGVVEIRRPATSGPPLRGRPTMHSVEPAARWSWLSGAERELYAARIQRQRRSATP